MPKMAPRGEPTASIVGMVAACAALVLTRAAPVRAEPPEGKIHRVDPKFAS